MFFFCVSFGVFGARGTSPGEFVSLLVYGGVFFVRRSVGRVFVRGSGYAGSLTFLQYSRSNFANVGVGFLSVSLFVPL